MKLKSKLIYQSESTCFQTPLPVFFFGMSDGRMLVIYSRFKTENPLDTAQEWIVAQHLDYYYDFDDNRIFTMQNQRIDLNEFMNLVDNLEQRVKIIKTFGIFLSNAEALRYLNSNSVLMLSSLKHAKTEMIYYTDWQM